MTYPVARAIAAALVLVSCQLEESRRAEPESATASEIDGDAAMVAAAKNVVAFLQDGTHLDRVRLADTVTLYVSPEGGGGQVRLSREQLADRSNWKVPAPDKGRSYSLIPPAEFSKLTTRPDRHFNCHEYQLASRFPALADAPHVGTKLEPTANSSCLRTWNLTFVFDRKVTPPTVIAAVYDQWEW